MFTVISPQLINLYIENTSLNTSSGNINSATNRSFGIRNSVSTGVIGATTNYIPGSSIEIAGFLDYMQQYVNIISDPGKASNYYHFVPGQNNFSIYIQNPNNTADKLMIIGGKNQTTTGKDANAPFGVDDNLYTFSGLTYLTSSNLTQYNKIQSINQTGSVGYFDLLARLPSRSELSTLGIAYGSVTLYVVFGGNNTLNWNSPNLPSWTVKTYTITISNSANLQASPSPTSTFIVPNYPRNSSIFNATLTDGATGPISGQAFNYALYNNATDPTPTGIP